MHWKAKVRTGVFFAMAMASLLFLYPEQSFAKDKEAKGQQVVDEGSFGVFVDGKRVGTEKFTIRQVAEGSVTTSEIRMGDGKAHQSAELRMNASGDLLKYEWREHQPQKASSVVEPNQGFVTQKLTTPEGKNSDQPYLLPPSSPILEDFFFSHRELLLWRYLGANCRPNEGGSGCTLEKAQFGAIVPRQHTSVMLTIAYEGRERVLVKGAERELSKFSIKQDGPDWSLWVDENHKLLRITIPETNTEVVRD